jgi:hypothetical protein
MRDSKTGSTWLLLQGKATEGALKDKTLQQVAATPWLVERWEAFYPKGPVYK